MSIRHPAFFALALMLAAAPGPAIAAPAPGAVPKLYVCPPCGQPCDARTFDKPGTCPACGMELVERVATSDGSERPATAKRSPLEGDWAGSYQIGSTRTALEIHVASVNDTLRPRVDLVPFESGLPVVSMSLSDTTLAGRVEHNGDWLEFQLAVHDAGLSGRATTQAGSAPVQLIRLARVDHARLKSYEGMYRAGNRTFLFEILNDTWGLTSVELPSGRTRAMFAISDSSFVNGPALMFAQPEYRRLTFSSGGRLQIRQNDTLITAVRVPLEVRDVLFPSGDAMLAGTLVLPPTKGRHPGIVFMHGSGASPRTSFFGMGYWLAAQGFAVLKYDKRGSGESTGSLEGFTYEQLGKDGAAGARFLAAQPEVDSLRIGFWGISEGAWTCVLAASRFPHTAFVIPVSGGGLSPAAAEMLDTEDQLRGDGRFSESQVRDAVAFQSARDRFARTGEGWDAYARVRAEAVRQPWWGYPATDLFGPSKPDSPFWGEKRTTYFYEPTETLRRLHCPLLSIFGEFDTPKGIRASQKAMRSALRAPNNQDATFVILRHSNHNLLDASSGSERELPLSDHFTPSLYPITLEWLVKRVHPDAGL